MMRWIAVRLFAIASLAAACAQTGAVVFSEADTCSRDGGLLRAADTTCDKSGGGGGGGGGY